MGGARNRRSGHSFERNTAKKLREIGFNRAITSRAGDRSKDEQGQDILNTEPFQFQNKFTQNFPNFYNILKEMPQNASYNVVLHKRKNKGSLAILSMDDFLQIIEMLKTEKII